MSKYCFQLCQKLVVFSADLSAVLLCRRKDEDDYDGVFSFVGGKMEATDDTLLEALRREKDEEVGEEFKLKVAMVFTANRFFSKKDGAKMILPHYFAMHVKGPVVLSAEYSEYKWVKLKDLDNFEPKISNISGIVQEMLRLVESLGEDDFEYI